MPLKNEHHIGRAKNASLPAELRGDYYKAVRLEWITVTYLVSVAVVMYLATGSSQAMQAAWIEDVVSIFPAVTFLLASKVHRKPANSRFPYGFQKSFTVAFVGAAIALLVLGLYALLTSIFALCKAEHPTIGSISLFGHSVWTGWLMLLALLYSSVPSVILGRMKLPLSERLHEKVLFVDSHAQKADWMTAAGGMLGIIGIGFGLWWADSVLAILISASIVYDGFTRTRDSMKDLLEETPMTTDNKNLHPLIDEVIETCLGHQWVVDVKVRMREQGMFFFGDILVVPRDQTCLVDRIAQLHSQVLALDWKIADLVISPVKDFSLLEQR